MRKLLFFAVITALPVMPAQIGAITIDLPSLNLAGSGGVPLGRAPGGGYQFVQSQVAVAATGGGVAVLSHDGQGPITEGTLLTMEITLTGSATVTIQDIDPTYDYFGLPSTIQRSVSFSSQSGPATCSADPAEPNYGCFPPVGVPLMGVAPLRVDLPVDIDGNGLPDKLLIDRAMHEVEEILSRTVHSSTVTTTFRVSSSLSGAVLDQANDPPFSVGLTGVGTGIQSIAVAAVPEPATYWFSSAALGGLLWLRRRK
jgi:hypothetical protein